jgi:potassium/hydrogen antiporter
LAPTVDHSILLISILLLIGVLTAKFSTRLGVPSLVFFIIVGMVVGHYIYFHNALLTQGFGILALIVTLFDGGVKTNWKDVKRVSVPSVLLATLGVLITTVLIGIIAKYILGVTWLEGFLFGAIVSSTDAAAVFSVLGIQNIRQKLNSTLEAESGSNDPMAIFLTVSIIELIQHPNSPVLSLILSFFWQMGIGLLLGLLLGKVSVWIINYINLDSSGLYSVLTLSLAVLTYGISTSIEASGLLAVYIMAVVVGNADLTYRHAVIRFNEGFAWMMKILMFMLLGLLVFPKQLVDIIWEGILLSLLLMFIARPLGVFFSMMFAKYSVKEKLFISWAGLKGAVPIVLATYPIIAGLENSTLIFNVVFFVVLISALFQGATVAPLAKFLNLSQGEKETVPHSLELISIGRTNNEMIELKLIKHSDISGMTLEQLQLPEYILVTAVIRDDKLLTPRGNTQIFGGDTLYILVAKKKREKVKAFFQRNTGRSTNGTDSLTN